MKLQAALLTLTSVCLLLPAEAAKKPVQTGWGYAGRGPVDVFEGLSLHPKLVRKLGRGALLAVYGEKERDEKHWSEVMAIKPATLEETLAWVESSRLKFFDTHRFPANEDLFMGAGAPFTDDVVAADTVITRLLLQQASRPPLLVCLFDSPGLPNVRLQIFTAGPERYAPGPYLEFPNAEIRTPIGDLEARDAVGDGNECLISHEAFTLGEPNRGVRFVVRRFEGGTIKPLWTAPLEYTNLGFYEPKPHKLSPPERNAGAPGTVTKATAEFAVDRGKPGILWKAIIEFHIPGREKPVDTLTVEKRCAWTGSRFEPIE